MTYSSYVARQAEEAFLPIIPNNYKVYYSKDIKTGEDIKPYLHPSSFFGKTPIPLWELYYKGVCWRARTPIGIRVRTEENFFFAENDVFCVYGTGLSAQDAIDDFKNHLGHFINYYNSLPIDKFIGAGLDLKKRFEKTFLRI